MSLKFIATQREDLFKSLLMLHTAGDRTRGCNLQGGTKAGLLSFTGMKTKINFP